MLVDPQSLEQLKVDREYKQIQKPADSVVRTNSSLDMGKTLNDDTLSDDQKVQTLNRYYQVTDEVPITSTSKSNPLTEVAAQRKKKEEETSDLVAVLGCHMSIPKHRVVSVAYRTSDGMVAK